MSDLSAFLEFAFESPIHTCLTVFLFLAAVRGIYEAVKWIKGELNNWYVSKNSQDKKEETIDDRISKLEKENSLQFEKLSSLEDSMIAVNESLVGISQFAKKQAVVTIRAEINRIYSEVKEQGYITQAQYTVFSGLSEVYLASDGNGLFKNKIIPEIEGYPIKD